MLSIKIQLNNKSQNCFIQYLLSGAYQSSIFQKIHITLKFQNTYDIVKYNLKELDKYLWQFGKKHFPKQY